MLDAASLGVALTPTLHMFAATVSDQEHYLSPIRAALRQSIDAGGRVLFGTDVGYLPDRDPRAEYEAMAQCGMSAAEILASLMTAPAEFFGRADAVTCRRGALADLTVLASRASAPEPSDLADLHAVIRGGRLVHRV